MATEGITVAGISQYQEVLRQLQTDNPRTHRMIQGIVARAISEARAAVAKDSRQMLDNDPRSAYKAVRRSVYKQLLGGQINILPSRRRGMATKYVRKRKLDETPNQRGGNRRKRSRETMRMESYQGADRGFILCFVNAGTRTRTTRYGNRGAIRPRGWFSVSSGMQVDAAAVRVAEQIEEMLGREFQQM